MKKFKLILLITFLSITIFVNASEQRLSALSGISYLGLYVTPDTWCDSFYVNPAYGAEAETNILNAYSNFYYNKYQIEDSDDNYERNYISNTNKIGMLIPMKKFTLGWNLSSSFFNYNIRYSTTDATYSYYLNNYGYDLDDFDYSCAISHSLLLSWQISPSMNFGFNIDTDIKPIATTPGTYVFKKEVQQFQDIVWKMNLGFLSKKNNHKLSISFPIEFRHEFKDNTDSDADILEHKGFMGGYSGVNIVTEVFLPKNTTLRLINTLKIDYEYYKKCNKFNFFNIDNSKSYYFYNQFHIPLLSSFSVNHNIKEKVLLFYGLDLGIKSYFGFGKENRDFQDYFYEFNGVCINIEAGTFFGAEFYPLRWLTIRIGLKTLFINYINNKNFFFVDEEHTIYDLTPNERGEIQNEKFSIPLDTSFSAGISFNPHRIISIELNSNFIFSGTELNEEKTNSYASTTNTFSVGFTLGLVIKPGKQKNKNETSDTDAKQSETEIE